ncbi:uncharacterized protein LOC142972596 [Anticarsia gemmatalis]|uniref:uncharacterized protein LOC142972596 n=1 Tax=Anticarsia gemmatalis TaxID=129554 RepID=UPI003F77671B
MFVGEPVTNDQLRELITHLETDSEMCYDKTLQNRDPDPKWEELANKLNNVPNGTLCSTQRWKCVVSNWKQCMNWADEPCTDEIVNPRSVFALSTRLQKLMDEEKLLLKGTNNPGENGGPSEDSENREVFRRPILKFSRKRYGGRNGRRYGEIYILTDHRPKHKPAGLKAICDNNVGKKEGGDTEKRIMETQLDRLQNFSEELEDHIQDVQTRIQKIKDIWEHDCDACPATAANSQAKSDAITLATIEASAAAKTQATIEATTQSIIEATTQAVIKATSAAKTE